MKYKKTALTRRALALVLALLMAVVYLPVASLAMGESLVVGQQPGAPGTNGGVLTTPPVVAALTMGSATPGVTVVASVKSGQSWTLGGTTTAVTAANGVAVFDNLTATMTGDKYDGAVITFTWAGKASVDSASFNIPLPSDGGGGGAGGSGTPVISTSGDKDDYYFKNNKISFSVSGASIPDGTYRLETGVSYTENSFTPIKFFSDSSSGTSDTGSYYYVPVTVSSGGFSISNKTLAGDYDTLSGPGLLCIKIYPNADSQAPLIASAIPIGEAVVGIDKVIPSEITITPAVGQTINQATEDLEAFDATFSKTITAGITGSIHFSGINLISDYTELEALNTGIKMEKVASPASGAIEQYTMGINTTSLSFLADKSARISVASPSFAGRSAADFTAAAKDVTGGAASNLTFDSETNTVSFDVNHFSDYTLSLLDNGDADSDGYYDADVSALKTFLDSESSDTGVSNGKQINDSYISNSPSTYGVTWSTINGVKRVTAIAWNSTYGYNSPKIKGSFNATALSELTSLTIEDTNNNSGVTAISVTGLNKLSYLSVGKNKLSGTLDLSGCTALTYVDCQKNALTGITLTGDINIVTLDCGYNQISGLDLTGLTKIETLKIYNNNLTSINVSNLSKLSYFDMQENSISSVNLSNNPDLTLFDCTNNNISSLNLTSNTKLERIYISGNNISSLILPTLTALSDMYCDNNRLRMSMLPISMSVGGGTYSYAPQKTITVSLLNNGNVIDLSSEAKIDGIDTTFEWHKSSDDSVITTGIIQTPGKAGEFTFDRTAYDGISVYCVMSNTKFAAFAGATALKTEAVTIQDLPALSQPILSVSGTTVSWGDVANAQSYVVQVWNDTPAQAGSDILRTTAQKSIDISALSLASGTYTVKVKAVGDNLNYKDSSYSTTTGILVTSKAALTAAINDQYTDGAARTTPKLTQSYYTVSTWSDYAGAVTTAIAVEGNAASTQTQIDDAVTAIGTKKAALLFDVPNVTNDDTANTVTGMATGLEYNLDGADSGAYTAYVAETFNAIDFRGAHILLVRRAADGVTPAGDAKTLTFTINPPIIGNNYKLSDGSYLDATAAGGHSYVTYVRSGVIYVARDREEEIEVTGGGSDSSPAIAVQSDGTVHIVFVRSGNVMYAKYNGTWSIETVGAGGNPDIDVDTSGYAHIVYMIGNENADVIYTTNTSGSFVSSVIWDGFWYYDNGSGTGRYFYTPPSIKVDSTGHYHISIMHQAYDKAMDWQDHNYYIIYKNSYGVSSDSGSFGNNGSVGQTKNALSLIGDTPYITYNVSGNVYQYPSTVLTAGSSPASASAGGKVGIVYNNSGVKYIQSSGGGFSGAADIDAAGSGAVLAMDASNIFIYYIKDSTIYLATDKTVSPPIPSLSKPVLSVSGTTVSWGDVANETSYSLQVYQNDGTTTVGSAITLAQNSTSYNLETITPALGCGQYKVKVTAVGDGVNYLSSSPSALSDSITIKNKVSIAVKSLNPTQILNNGSSTAYYFTITGTGISSSGDTNPVLLGKYSITVSDTQNCTYNAMDPNAYIFERKSDDEIEATVYISSNASSTLNASFKVTLGVQAAMAATHEVSPQNSVTVSGIDITDPPPSGAPSASDIIVTRTSYGLINLSVANVVSGGKVNVYLSPTDGMPIADTIAMGTTATITGASVEANVSKIYVSKKDDNNHSESQKTEITIPTYIATVTPSGNQTFNPLINGYQGDSQPVHTFTVNSTGTGTLGNINVTLTGADSSSFTLVHTAGSPTFTIKANNGLSDNTTYNATVTVSADYINDISFNITQAVTNLPSLSAPTLGVSGTTVSWDAVTNAVGYVVNVKKGGSTVTGLGAVEVTGTNINLALLPGQTKQTLVGGSDYTVSVKAKGDNVSYLDSGWTDLSPAAVTLPLLALDTPGNFTASGTTISWGAVSNVSYYEVDILKNGVSLGGALSNVSMGSNTSIDLATFGSGSQTLPGGTYSIKVTAKGFNPNGYGDSAKSAQSGTVTLPALKLPTPSGISVSGSTVSWTAVTGASSYSVNIQKGGSTVSGLGAVSILSGTSIDLALLPGQSAQTLGGGSDYTVMITAKGDNSAYSDSDASAQSGSVTVPPLVYEQAIAAINNASSEAGVLTYLDDDANRAKIGANATYTNMWNNAQFTNAEKTLIATAVYNNGTDYAVSETGKNNIITAYETACKQVFINRGKAAIGTIFAAVEGVDTNIKSSIAAVSGFSATGITISDVTATEASSPGDTMPVTLHTGTITYNSSQHIGTVTLGLSYDGLTDTYTIASVTIPAHDATAPTATSTTVTASDITSSSLTLTWTAASDNVTAASDIKYYVFKNNDGKTASDMDTATKLLDSANAILLNMGGSANITSYVVTNLNPGTQYYFVVAAVDKLNNALLYSSVSVATTFGGGGGGGGGGTPAKPQGGATNTTSGSTTTSSTTVTPTTDTNTGKMSASVSSTTLNSLVESAKKSEQSGQNAVIEIKVQTNDQSTVKQAVVEIPKDSFEKVAEETKAGVKVNSPIGTITFDQKAVETINDATKEGSVSISISKVDASTLSSEVQAKVGDRPVYNFSVKAGNSEVSKFNGGTAEVSVPYTPKPGEKENSIVVYYVDSTGGLKAVRGKYDSNTGMVSFTTAHFSQYVIAYNEVNFGDVLSGSWYYDAVGFIAARSITTGTGENMFSPDKNLTRGQYIVMIMKAYGIDVDTEATDNFADAGSTYYTQYLATAKKLGIAGGIGDNMYAPEKEISRQDMFVLLYRTLKAIGQLPTVSTKVKTLSDFNDANSVSDYAKEAMELFVGNRVITGSNNQLTPLNTSTRAQMAQVLYNLLSK